MICANRTQAAFALSLSKGFTRQVQGHFGKLRTGFDKALLSKVEGLSPNGG
jgi:hypothetical protein